MAATDATVAGALNLDADKKRVARWVAGAALAGFALYLLASAVGIVPKGIHASPVAVGIIAVLSVWALYSLAIGHMEIWEACIGFDGRPSTSKFQAFLWTAVVIFAYAAVANATGSLVVQVPAALFGAMGFSLITFGAAKAISARRSSESVSTDPKDRYAWRFLFLDDKERVDFGKLQIVAWTVVAVGLFTLTVINSVTVDQASLKTTVDGAAVISLPDIGTSLVVLQGLGSAVYLGNKLVGVKELEVTEVSPRVIEPDSDRIVTIKGSGFGDAQGTTLIALHGEPIPPSAWTDKEIRILVPTARRDGSAWPTDQELTLAIGTAQWTLRIATRA